MDPAKKTVLNGSMFNSISDHRTKVAVLMRSLRALELTQKWKGTDRVEDPLKGYRKIYPGGSDIWNSWNELTRN